MSELSVADWIQVAAVVAAVAASGVALFISGRDQRNTSRIAAKDREISILLQELDYAVRLADIAAYGGATDADISKRNGAAKLAPVSALSDRVPKQWGSFSKGVTNDQIREYGLGGEDLETLVGRLSGPGLRQRVSSPYCSADVRRARSSKSRLRLGCLAHSSLASPRQFSRQHSLTSSIWSTNDLPLTAMGTYMLRLKERSSMFDDLITTT